jgi:hypothetical protein
MVNKMVYYKEKQMIAAPRLYGLTSPIQSKVERKRNTCFQDGGQIQRQKNIYHHNVSPVASICHFCTPPPLILHLNSRLFYVLRFLML